MLYLIYRQVKLVYDQRQKKAKQVEVKQRNKDFAHGVTKANKGLDIVMNSAIGGDSSHEEIYDDSDKEYGSRGSHMRNMHGSRNRGHSPNKTGNFYQDTFGARDEMNFVDDDGSNNDQRPFNHPFYGDSSLD